MVLNGIAVPEQPESLILPIGGGAGAAPSGSGVDALPAAAQICSCNNVSKQALCEAIAGGCTTLAALKKGTKAATTCGGRSAERSVGKGCVSTCRSRGWAER